MNKILDCIAVHEAGHAVAHILTGILFKFVTIKQDKEKDEHGLRSLDNTMYEHPKTSDEWNKFSFLNPKEFDWFFKEDFISLAGFVAELLYRWRSNY